MCCVDLLTTIKKNHLLYLHNKICKFLSYKIYRSILRGSVINVYRTLELRQTKPKQDWKLNFLFLLLLFLFSSLQGYRASQDYSFWCSTRASRYVICTCWVGKVWSDGVEIVVTRTSVHGRMIARGRLDGSGRRYISSQRTCGKKEGKIREYKIVYLCTYIYLYYITNIIYIFIKMSAVLVHEANGLAYSGVTH